MTAHPHQGTSIYNKNLKTQPQPTGNSRDIDARALSACARKLDDAKMLMETNAQSRDNFKIYGDALRSNQQLWTLFQVSLSDQENPLPQDLKGTLLNLSLYVDQTSFKAVDKYAPALIDSLININRRIAAGLSKQPTGEAYTLPPDTRDIPTALMTSA